MAASISLLLLAEFRKFISSSKNGKRTKYAGRRLARGTIEQYRCIEKLLQEFEAKYHTTLHITLLKKYSQSALKKEKKYWQSFFSNFVQFLYKEKGYFDNYASSVLKVIRTFFNYLREEKAYPVSEFYKRLKLSPQSFTPVVLEPCQLRFLICNTEFEYSLPSHLKRTKDIFVFGCTVALRYSDLMKLQKKHVIKTPSGNYLLIHTQKTGTEVRLPLPDYLTAILNKYTKGKYLLPKLSCINLNLQVKQLVEKAGWDYQLPKIRYKAGKPFEIKNKKHESLRFCDHITSHTMRRTAITTLLIMGVPEQIVRRISGHAPHSREFYRYVVIAGDYLNNHVRQAYDRLINE